MLQMKKNTVFVSMVFLKGRRFSYFSVAVRLESVTQDLMCAVQKAMHGTLTNAKRNVGDQLMKNLGRSCLLQAPQSILL